MKRLRGIIFLLGLLPVIASGQDYNPQRDQRLLIEIHVWGEVTRPGMYRVVDGSTILDAISAAGGPTENAAISRVRLSRTSQPKPTSEKIDLDEYIGGKSGQELPVLRPGDMVMVPRSSRFFWKEAIRFVADIAIILNVYYLIAHNR